LISNEKSPFEEWRAPSTSIWPELEDFIQMHVFIYQIYVFRILTAIKFGNPVAVAIIDTQINHLSKGDEKFSLKFEKAIDHIHLLASEQVEDPTKININGKSTDLPFEYVLAVKLLVSETNTPFPVKDADGILPDFNNQDYAFAECLACARDKMKQFTEACSEGMKIVINSK
jgi:hypothetical protein